MEEVLVWVMDGDDGTRILIGSFGTNGVIYRCAWADGEIDRGTYRTKLAEQTPLDVCGITQRAEGTHDMVLPPTVLRVVPPPFGRSPALNTWVDLEVVPVVEARMAVLS